MYKGNEIGVVITAYNEEQFIENVVGTIPDFVDKIYVVDDGSTDATLSILSRLAETNRRLVIIPHWINQGVGAGKISGYKMALRDCTDVTVMMAGDGQTDPAYLDSLLDPIVDGIADYTKGSRLLLAEHKRAMPKFRLLGNSILTWLTRLASGYWHITDPQDGYTAMSRKVLKKLDLNGLCTGWPAENDILIKLNVIEARVMDIPHPAVYGQERSSIKYPLFVVVTSRLLLRRFAWRIREKYISRTSTVLRTEEGVVCND